MIKIIVITSDQILALAQSSRCSAEMGQNEEEARFPFTAAVIGSHRQHARKNSSKQPYITLIRTVKGLCNAFFLFKKKEKRIGRMIAWLV